MEYIKIHADENMPNGLVITDELDRNIDIGQEFLAGIKITMEELAELDEGNNETIDELEGAVEKLEGEIEELDGVV